MKPPETVTLIDLDRKVHRTLDLVCPVTLANLQTDVYYNKKVYQEPYYSDENLREKLVAFLNDQQTFIRNGMWETLAIYQATLGRFWEVPWYELTVEQSSLFRHRYQMIQNHRNYYKTTKKGIIRFQPFCESFIKHYSDVFSKLIPWKGESTDVN
jgi:hypothetical protein